MSTKKYKTTRYMYQGLFLHQAENPVKQPKKAKNRPFLSFHKTQNATLAILGPNPAIFKVVDKLLKNFKIPPVFSILERLRSTSF